MNELLLIGHLKGPGGYERHGRVVLKGLTVRGVRVQVISLPYSMYGTKLSTDMKELIRQAEKTEVSLKAPVMFLCIPNLIFRRRSDGMGGPIFGRYNINYTTWEADRICKEWVQIGNLMDLTIVTNSFLKDVWVNSGVKEEKVAVVEEGTFPELFHPDVKPLNLLDENGVPLIKRYRNRFIAVMEHSPRKNLEALLRTFVKAFAGDDETCLIVKISRLERLSRGMLSFSGCKDAHIYTYSFVLPEYIMPNFLAMGTHYFSMSHGEGWDLTCNDMGAMGRVLVVPNHTAYSTYLDSDIAYLIEANKKEPAYQPPPLDKFFEGSQWWIPDEDDAVDKLRASVKQDTSNMRKKLLKYIRENYTWQNVGQNLLDLLIKRGVYETNS